MKRAPWIGVDYDGTLAKRDGTPIRATVDRVRRMLAQGERVKILTGRPKSDHQKIARWTSRHIGTTLPVTNKKDSDLIRLYDDRAVGVHANKGTLK